MICIEKLAGETSGSDTVEGSEMQGLCVQFSVGGQRWKSLKFCFGILIGPSPNLKVCVNLCKENSFAKTRDKNCKDQHNFCSHTWYRELEHPIIMHFQYGWPLSFRVSECHAETSICYSSPPFLNFFFLTILWMDPTLNGTPSPLRRVRDSVGKLWDPSVLHPSQEMGEAEEQQDSRTSEGRFHQWDFVRGL